ncbi:MAG: hypothetical protein ABI746_08730 [Dermatophilaceae bacterium]
MPLSPTDHGPTRRTMLGALGALGAVTLCGCGGHLEDDAPRLPLIPTRTVDPRASAVADELRLVRRARAACAALREGNLAGLSASLAALHATQEGVLAARVRELGEDPDDRIRLPESATGTTPAPVTSLAQGESLGLDVEGRQALSHVPGEEVALVLSVRTQRVVAAPLVGVSLAAWPDPACATPAEAARLLAAARSTEYGLQVAAARGGADPSPVADALRAAEETRRALEVLPGGAAASAALGYDLPFPVPDAVAATRLAVTCLQGFSAAVIAGGPAAVGNTEALVTLLRWAALAENLARTLGVPLQAFPGLHLSEATPPT